jgi:hypothetical protein
MPKYFFNVSDGRRERDDDEGAELPNEAAAFDMAKQVADDLSKDGAYDGLWIVVRDELENELCRVPVTRRH